MKTEKFVISGMTCASCQANITRNVEKITGVESVNVNLLANQMSVVYDNEKLKTRDIVSAVDNIGYGATSMEGEISDKKGFKGQWNQRQEYVEKERDSMKKRLIISIILLVPLMYIAMGHMLSLPVSGIFIGTENILISAFTQMIIASIVLIINKHFFIGGFKALINKSPNMDTLVAVGSGASMIYGIFAIYRMMYGMGHGDMNLIHRYAHVLYFESSAMILTLVTLGKYLEARSKSKTSDALGKLINLAPKRTSVIRNGEEQTILSENVIANDIIIIRPGDIIPVDGIITEGNGYVDQSAITGESIAVEKKTGDNVISATINKNGTFKFEASRVGEDTTLAQIIRLVDEAGNSKAPIARLADKISGIFVPIVLGIALLTAIGWLIAGYDFEFALNCAVSVLVISCPCALGLATPVAIMVGTGKAAEYGILVKSAESLEKLHLIDTIVLDKTGTITSGNPSVTDIIVLDETFSEKEFLEVAASLELGSTHPLAKAVIDRAKLQNLIINTPHNFELVNGRGVKADIAGSTYIAGNTAFMEEQQVVDRESHASKKLEELSLQGKTPLIFAKNRSIIGIIAVADTIRDTSREAVSRFKDMGIHVIMLTGDNNLVAETIRKELNLEEAIAGVLPDGKEAEIRSLQEKGHKVLMVGDGINDAPALIRADIGIAIGAGTDIAIDSADIVLMKDSLMDVVTAIKLSKSVVKNIHMNLFWAFFYNVLGIPVAAGLLYPAFGLLLSPMIGSAAMSVSSVSVVLNALRLRFFKSSEEQNKQQDKIQTIVNISNNENDKNNKREDIIMKKTLVVEGMMCAHCQNRVQKALESVEGVSGVVVNLESKEAIVQLTKDVLDNDLKNAVTEAGYTVLSCEEVEKK